MKKIIGSFIFCAAAIIIFSVLASSKNTISKNNTVIQSPEKKGIVIMELFTSQGCSSCPPADALLGEYAIADIENIIPLSFHVDYWNRLGWADPFSKTAYSNRQRMYAEKISGGSVYTPQLVINGEKEMVGSQRDQVKNYAKAAGNNENSTNINIIAASKLQNVVSVHYTIDAMEKGDILNIALVQASVQTNIKHGENSGLNITNYNVVRDFKTVKTTASGSETLTIPASEAANEKYFVVLYTQEHMSGKITGGSKKIL